MNRALKKHSRVELAPEERPKLPEAARNYVSHEGRKFPLIRDNGGLWRMRSRSKSHAVDVGLGTTNLSAAKIIAKAALENRPEKHRRGAKTLEDLAKFYQSQAPRRCNDTTAANNIGRLRTVVRTALKKELANVRDSELTCSLWPAFVAVKHNGKADFATRRPENEAINAAMRTAAALFTERLLPIYKEAGFQLAASVGTVQWLPIMAHSPKPADDEALIEAWEDMEEDDLRRPLWLAIGLARFAGLRRSEIEHARRSWLVERKGRPYIELRDRPEENYLTKTGKPYRALILSDALAEKLKAVPDGEFLVPLPTHSRHNWFVAEPQAWVAQFTSAPHPLHRLRGLYADQIKELTEDAVAAHLAGVKAASNALGHTNTKTTVNHYLSGD